MVQGRKRQELGVFKCWTRRCLRKLFAFFTHMLCPPNEEGPKCQSALHEFPSSGRIFFLQKTVFHPPSPHTVDLLTASPSCCLFSFNLILLIFSPLRIQFWFVLNLFCLFIISLFSCLDSFSPVVFLLPSCKLAGLPTYFFQPRFHTRFPFTFLQTHRPFVSLSCLQLHRVFSSPLVTCKQLVSAFWLLPQWISVSGREKRCWDCCLQNCPIVPWFSFVASSF